MSLVNLEPVPPDADPTQEQLDELSDDVQTVADEILVEVKECRSQQDKVTADLESLRAEGRETSQQFQAQMTELKNLREENRSLSQELKTLLSQNLERNQLSTQPLNREPEASPSLTPTTSQPIVVIADPSVAEESPEVKIKTGRHRI